MKPEEALKKIAESLIGIADEDLTQSELRIVTVLIQMKVVKVEKRQGYSFGVVEMVR